MYNRHSATELLQTIVTLIETWFLAEERENVKAMLSDEGWDKGLSLEEFLYDDFMPPEDE